MLYMPYSMSNLEFVRTLAAMQMLLVWEYGSWKSPGGAVDATESKLTAVIREVWEEVGVKIDAEKAPVYLGGWHQSCSRDRLVLAGRMRQRCIKWSLAGQHALPCTQPSHLL